MGVHGKSHVEPSRIAVLIIRNNARLPARSCTAEDVRFDA